MEKGAHFEWKKGLKIICPYQSPHVRGIMWFYIYEGPKLGCPRPKVVSTKIYLEETPKCTDDV